VLWRNILNRFKAVDVLIADVKLTRSWPGGPIDALFVARHGPDATELGRFSLRTNSPAGLDAMLDTGVRQVDAIYAQALRDGRLRAEPDLSADLAPIVSAAPIIATTDAGVDVSSGGIDAEVATPDSSDWTAIERKLRATPTVTGVTLTSLSLGGSSRIVIRHNDTRELLDYWLDQNALRLVPVAGGLLLRPREPSDPVVAKPVVVEAPAGEAAGGSLTTTGPATKPAVPVNQAAPAAPPKTAAPADLLPEAPK
jgi:hypothetical protein